MPTNERTHIVKFQGGLNLSNSELDAIEAPGWCESMINFEADIRGGYRRIDGYQRLGGPSATVPDVFDANILAVACFPFFLGVVVVRNGNVWYSDDGISWVQVNKDTGDTFVDATTLLGLPALPRNTTGFESYSFDVWNNGTDEELIFVDSVGNNPIGRLTIRDNGGTIEYKYREASDTDWGGTSRYPSTVTILGDRFIYGKDPANKASVYYSNLFDPFDMVGGGEVSIADRVMDVRSFRENAIIFGRNSIHQFVYIGDPVNEAVVPVTTNLGCVATGSIQELSGDLLFLAPDGIRTVAGTQRIGDVELGTVSFNIHQLFPDIISDIDNYHVTSTVIRRRSNYRLFFHNKDVNDATQIGIGLVLRRGGSGPIWEWNQFSSLPVWDINSDYDESGVEKVFHVANVKNFDFLYEHNAGSTFDGVNVNGSFKVPYITMGDPETRKTIYDVRVYSKGEGMPYNYGFKLGYDVDESNTHSPALYVTDNILPDSTYGTGVYSTATYGSGSKETQVFNVVGSGKSVDITFASRGASHPFTIQGVSLSYMANGRY